MSYILDALKRSERERRQGKPPNIYSEHESYLQHKIEQKKSSISGKAIVFASVFFASGLVLATVLYKFSITKSTVSPETAIHLDPPLAKEAVRLENNPQKAQVTETPPRPQERNQNTQVDPPQVESSTVIDPTPPIITTDKKKVLLQTPPASTLSTPVLDVPDPVVGDAVPFEKLPSSLQAMIPPLEFAGHAYSKTPSRRMIIVNNSILKEGQSIDKETRLLEITYNGVIIEFEGKRIIVKTDE